MPPLRLVRRLPSPRLLLAGAATIALAGALPASGEAAVMTFGSSLSEPASENTAANLNYTGTTFAYGTGTVHINHDGADTALWNTALGSGSPTAPADGQITSITLEGCAEPAANGPAPTTQIHFQALTPQGSGVVIDVTTQPFDIPVCGADGASGSTETVYQPTNFCVHQGDYVDFNDEGGFDSTYYPSGVPYQVLGGAGGSTVISDIAHDQTNNGDVFSPSVSGATNGWATNGGEELMMQTTLATGPDATPLCPGGTQGQKPPAPQAGQPGGPPGLTIPHPQHENVSRQLVVQLSVYCAQALPCNGSVSLTNNLPASAASGPRVQAIGTAGLAMPGRSGTHVPMRVSATTMALLRKHRAGIPVTMTVTLANGVRTTQVITLLQ